MSGWSGCSNREPRFEKPEPPAPHFFRATRRNRAQLLQMTLHFEVVSAGRTGGQAASGTRRNATHGREQSSPDVPRRTAGTPMYPEVLRDTQVKPEHDRHRDRRQATNESDTKAAHHGGSWPASPTSLRAGTGSEVWVAKWRAVPTLWNWGLNARPLFSHRRDAHAPQGWGIQLRRFEHSSGAS